MFGILTTVKLLLPHPAYLSIFLYIFVMLLFARMLGFFSLQLRKPIIIVSAHSFSLSVCFVLGTGDADMNKT